VNLNALNLYVYMYLAPSCAV